VSNNWGYFGNPEFDKLIADARTQFDDKKRDEALSKLHHVLWKRPPSCGSHTMSAHALSAPRLKASFRHAAGLSI